MSATENLKNMSLARKLVVGAGALLLVDSFLPWYHISIGGLGGVSASGWHGIGVLAWLLVIVLLALEGVRIAGVLPLDEGLADLATLAVAAGAVFFGLIYVIVRLTDGHLGFGFYIGVVALLALGAGVVALARSGAAVTALKDLQATAAKKSG